jgi:hypothetical protein
MAQMFDASLRQGLASLTWRTPTVTPSAKWMLAVTAGAFLLVTWIATKGLFFFLQESSIR